MWVVLQESVDLTEGYVVVDDSTRPSQWGVAEYVHDGKYALVTAASSVSEALNGM